MTRPWAQLKAQRRQQARESGLCITCCKIAPEGGRSVCKTCITRTVHRTAQARSKKRRVAGLQKIIEAHVHHGDEAYLNNLYAEAAQHYQDALGVETITAAEQSRIAGRLADALSLGSNPDEATLWLDRAIESSLKNPGDSVKSTYMLSRKMAQLWTNFQMEACLVVATQMIKIATISKNSELRIFANCEMVQCLLFFGRLEEIDRLVHSVEKLHEAGNATTRRFYYVQKAISAAATGKMTKAFACFEEAVAASEQASQLGIVVLFSLYAEWALTLGDIERAKALAERALLHARQYHVAWYIPVACLHYAQILFTFGKYENAREYILQALAHETVMPNTVPMYELAIGEIGIPLALHFGDEVMLAKCVRHQVLEKALRSGGPEIISAAAQFAGWYRHCGRDYEARAAPSRN